ncbi:MULTISPECIES: helix-turn-helix transcriptional regulator [unclassified Myroides]|uniref:AraC family transcriptional regulator n=1 Tax=unclassified Myroides TaxID=2642485 RepID=UPI0015FD8A27|nr:MULTISPECIES: helix-turn-helix transcriptional regulator [unclassified Myroides]MBB1148978.1 helix-turn-helix transcriptional regulator [Myroides sp. NP-2]MDM1408163.1 helix-turn-helix transcriptional regulator [Myroides sp. DF42-4-2]
MAYLNKEQVLNLEEINQEVIGLASDLVQHDSGFHSHALHAQLLYAPSGCMTLLTHKQQVILPPQKLMFIPAGLEHRVTFRNVVAYRSIYLDIRQIDVTDLGLEVRLVSPLFAEVIERICWWEWQGTYTASQQNILAVFWDEFHQAQRESYVLEIPTDYRLQAVMDAFMLEKRVPPFLHELAQDVGASEKTISRIFKRETKMSYQAWRQQWRLYRAIELLAENTSISEVSDQLAFSSDSAFIEFFKNHTGITPAKYFL